MNNEIFQIPPERVFCLTAYAYNLSTLRQVRLEHLGSGAANYATLQHVNMELNYARFIFSKQPLWPVITVTNKPIEEIASEILAIKKAKIASLETD